MASPERFRILVALVAISVLGGCAGRSTSDGAATAGSAVPPDLPQDAIPRKEPKSRYGNGPYYEVYGVSYEVLDSSYGYKERGVASWYGKKFHGRPTSSQEPYDMYGMTAAHKTLPLPTYVRVRNLKNNKTIVVRVNDRGPFVDNRIIDLLYSAAIKLDMVKDGTGLVELTALSYDEPLPPKRIAAPASPGPDTDAGIFVQAGAFGDRNNAQRRYDMLRARGIGEVVVHKDNDSSPALYRIRIGPINDVAQYDAIVQRLQNMGISNAHLVTAQ